MLTFSVIASKQNEFLLGRLVLSCSQVILRHISITNASSLACEASFHNALDLKRSIFSYIACNLETMLENGMLDQMELRVLHDLASFVQDRQGMKLPVSRSGILLDMAVEKRLGWLEQQDIPFAKLRAPRHWKVKSPRIIPVNPQTPVRPGKERARQSIPAIGDDIFAMEDDLPPPAIPANQPQKYVSPKPTRELSSDLPSSSGSPWRSKPVDPPRKTDLRSIMAETAGRKSTAIGNSKPMGSPIPTPQRAPVSFASPSRGPEGWKTPNSGLSASPGPGPSSLSKGANTFVPGGSQFPSLGSPANTRPATPRNTSSFVSSGTGIGSVPMGQNGIPAGPSRPTPKPAVINPTRYNSNSNRKVSNDAAWTVPTLSAPPIETLSLSPTSAAVSLLSIQEAQTRQNIAAAAIKDTPRSLLEIQEQEKRDEESRVAEREFEKWWKEEEARVAREMAKVVKSGGGGGGGPGGGGKKKSKPKARGGAVNGAGGGGRGGGNHGGGPPRKGSMNLEAGTMH